MILAATVSALDPTAQVLLTIFGGALVATLGGLLGVSIQARRDHAKWVRERRYEAFITAIVLLRQVTVLMEEANKITAGSTEGTARGTDFTAVVSRAKELKTGWPEASAPLVVLGPDGVDKALGIAAEALGTDDPGALRAAERALVTTMRKALAIKE
ncbi:hypothetical protein [Cryobacterium sp. M91]|uniref:hypothetical protein n=1 Tax=Cryobacterium sp. M91 TaxID=2048294 RepID=UPI000CE3F572|nr:hypothetical protein [Cryobacterium sp. M91]